MAGELRGGRINAVRLRLALSRKRQTEHQVYRTDSKRVFDNRAIFLVGRWIFAGKRIEPVGRTWKPNVARCGADGRRDQRSRYTIRPLVRS
jgi:hypothetical protein